MVKIITSARAAGTGCHLTNSWVLWTFKSKYLQYSWWISNTMMQLSDILEALGGKSTRMSCSYYLLENKNTECSLIGLKVLTALKQKSCFCNSYMLMLSFVRIILFYDEFPVKIIPPSFPIISQHIYKMIKAENELHSAHYWGGLCMLEHGDVPVPRRGFLSSGQPLSQSLKFERLQELWEGTGLPVRMGSRHTMGCKASLESPLHCGVQTGQRTLVVLMPCCKGVSLGRWVITTVRFCVWLLGSIIGMFVLQNVQKGNFLVLSLDQRVHFLDPCAGWQHQDETAIPFILMGQFFKI